jgi:PH and SEC7 domain-containing protein
VNGTQQRRLSRVDLNFEEALRSQETVLIREGVDVNTLGADTSFSPESFSSPQTPQIGLQPATPTVVPPTPTPTNHGAGPSSATLYPSSPPVSQNDTSNDADEREFQTNRRSMYRSPGSASSPDLATLLRKSKQKRQDGPIPPLKQIGTDGLDQSGGRLRTTSTTPLSPSSAPQGRYMTERFLTPNEPGSNNRSPDWVLTSPRGAQENEGQKARRFCLFLLD